MKATLSARVHCNNTGVERSRRPMTWSMGTTIAAMAVAMMFVFVPRCPAASFQAVDKNQWAKIEAKTRQLSDAVEQLQEDMVAELSGKKEKQLFQHADQVLHELVKMEKLLGKSAPARGDLYKQFDGIDAKVAVLRKAVPESAPKTPLVLVRGTERLRTLMDDLHYAVSQGDVSPERVRQVLVRQAKAMSDVTKKLSLTAQYTLGDVPGRGELLGDMKKLANAGMPFAKVAASPADLEKCRKEFAALNDAWRRVVQGISLLPPTENVYLIRAAMRADTIHERLFRLLEIKGERPFVTIGI